MSITINNFTLAVLSADILKFGIILISKWKKKVRQIARPRLYIKKKKTFKT